MFFWLSASPPLFPPPVLCLTTPLLFELYAFLITDEHGLNFSLAQPYWGFPPLLSLKFPGEFSHPSTRRGYPFPTTFSPSSAAVVSPPHGSFRCLFHRLKQSAAELLRQSDLSPVLDSPSTAATALSLVEVFLAPCARGGGSLWEGGAPVLFMGCE